MGRTLTAIVVAAVVLVLAAPLNARVLQFLAPFLGSCPEAISLIRDVFSVTLPESRETVYSPLDCLIGVFAWIAIPGAVGAAYHVFRGVR